MPTPIHPDRYDAATAAAMADLGNGLDGLPAFLGIRTTHIGPATMTAELDVRADLLNPFGTLQGGVLAALLQLAWLGWIRFGDSIVARLRTCSVMEG